MEYSAVIATLIPIAVIQTVGWATPGPNHLTIITASVTAGRAAGLRAAMGIAAGALTWTLVTVSGIAVIFELFPPLYLALRLIGGGYLIYLGINAFRAAWRSLQTFTRYGIARDNRALSHRLSRDDDQPQGGAVFRLDPDRLHSSGRRVLADDRDRFPDWTSRRNLEHDCGAVLFHRFGDARVRERKLRGLDHLRSAFLWPWGACSPGYR